MAEPNLLKQAGLCLLSLDGGGIRGLSSLFLLKGIMHRLNSERERNDLVRVKPCDIFDLVGGINTGGLIAIMLGRLEMDVDDCIEAYCIFASAVFDERQYHYSVRPAKYKINSYKLDHAIRNLVARAGLYEESLFNDGHQRGCKTFVCVADVSKNHLVRLRDYSAQEELSSSVSISEAISATLATTSFFDTVTIGRRTFADHGIGASNPVDQVEQEASCIWCSETEDLKSFLNVFVSIGTGLPGSIPMRNDSDSLPREILSGIATETESTERRFISRWAKQYDDRRYFRFNVDQGLQDTGLDEYKKLGAIEAATELYLTHQAAKFLVRDCVRSLQSKTSTYTHGYHALAGQYLIDQDYAPADASRMFKTSTPSMNSSYNVPLSLSGVPYRSSFVDRPDIMKRLETALLPTRTNPRQRIFTLIGMGGVGKTQMAIEFTTRHQEDFSAIFWFDGRSITSLKEKYSAIAKWLTLNSASEHSKMDDHDLAITIRAVHSWLNLPGNGRWLLVYDGVDETYRASNDVDEEYDINEFLPRFDQGSILITTRLKKLDQLGESLEVRGVDFATAQKILSVYNHTEVDSAASEHLHKLLGGLPLALAQAGTYMQQTGIGVDTYTSLYENHWTTIAGAENDQNSMLKDYPHRSTYTTWITSFDTLSKISPDAGNLLILWSHLASHDLWYGLLEPVQEIEPWNRVLLTFIGPMSINERKFFETMLLLQNYSMVQEVNNNDGLKVYSIHPVMHQWLYNCKGEQSHDEVLVVATAILGFAAARSFQKQYAREQPRILNHVEALSRLVPPCWDFLAASGKPGVDKRDNGAEESLLTAICYLGELYYRRRMLKDAEQIYSRALQRSQEVFGPSYADETILSTATNLAIIYREQGQLSKSEAMDELARQFLIVLAESDTYGGTTTANKDEVWDVGTNFSSDSSLDSSGRSGFVSQVADQLLGRIRSEMPDQQMFDKLCESMASLLKDFALRVGFGTENPLQRDIMYFTYRHSSDIVRSFREKYWLENDDDTEPNHERSDMISRETKDQMTEEWLNEVAPGDEELGDWTGLAEDPTISASADQDEALGDNAFEKYYETIIALPAYDWLLRNLRRNLQMDFEHATTLKQIRSEVISLLPKQTTISRHRSAQPYHCMVSLDWDPIAYYENQNFEVRPFKILDIAEAMERAITLTGSLTDAQALTTMEYMSQTWPATADSILSVLKKAFASKPGDICTEYLLDSTMVRVSLENGQLFLCIEGPTATIIEIIEQTVWIAITFRSSIINTEVMPCFPRFQSQAEESGDGTASDPTRFEIHFDMVRDMEQSMTKHGKCWHGLFRNPVLAAGYPIPLRPSSCTGIEMPLSMMTALVHAQGVDSFDNRLYIKGFSLMLIPVERFDKSLIWHLMCAKDGEEISYWESRDPDVHLKIELAEMMACRHFIGWCDHAKLLAGSKDHTYNTRSCQLNQPGKYWVINSFTLSVSKYVGGSVSTAIGVAHTPIQAEGDYWKKLDSMSRKYVMLWDIQDQRGWLINGTTALLHLAQASLKSHRKPQDSKNLQEPQGTVSHKPTTAFDILDDLDNRQIQLRVNKIVVETKSPVKLGEEATKNVTYTWYIFQDLIEGLYDLLQKAMEYRRPREKDGYPMTGRVTDHVDGWDFNEFYRELGDIHPRVLKLDVLGHGWNNLLHDIGAVTLFAEGFGDLIRPMPDEGCCETWKTVPSGKYYLAACGSDLSSIVARPKVDRVEVFKSAHLVNLGECQCQGVHSPTTQACLSLSKLRPKAIPQEGALILGYESAVNTGKKKLCQLINRDQKRTAASDSSEFTAAIAEHHRTSNELSVHSTRQARDSIVENRKIDSSDPINAEDASAWFMETSDALWTAAAVSRHA